MIIEIMKKRGIRVFELEDFMCRCGGTDFQIEQQDDRTRMTCRQCRRSFQAKKIEKRTFINNLPMSFGFRSLYWDKIKPDGPSLFGITEEGYEIKEM